MVPEPTPKISFVIIVLNGMPFVESAIQAVYPHAHEIIIVEGAVTQCLFAANPDGSSIDGTVEAIKAFPDPHGKITLLQGLWPEKLDMQNKALEFVSGDYVWLVDADEIYKGCDIETMRALLADGHSIARVDFIPVNFWKGFDFEFVSDRFQDERLHYRRVFRFSSGARFVSHRPPILTPCEGSVVSGGETRELGIYPYHYSYVYWNQVYQKIELYHRYGWGKQWGLDLDEWYREMFLRWTPENRQILEQRYPVWTGDPASYTIPFAGEHPDAVKGLLNHAPSPGLMEICGVSEDVAREVIGSPEQQRKALNAWRQIELDDPLIRQRETIGANLASGRSFWNTPVALAFLASALRPDSYLEVGVGPGGSLVQVLHHAHPRTATAVDLWARSYAKLPNTLWSTKRQFNNYRRCCGSTTDIRYLRGNSHLVLKRLIAEGRRYDLIKVGGNLDREGVWQNLENAIELLADRGAIVFDNIIDPAHRDLLSLVHRLKFRYPFFQIMMNTGQDNGCAIFLKNIDAEKLLRRGGSLAGMKVASGFAGDSADLTKIETHSEFSRVIAELFKKVRPRKIIETGTYHGTGTTKIIASLLRDLGIDYGKFFSIECNREHYDTARRNLAKEGLQRFVRLRHGLSLPTELLPSCELIREKYVNRVSETGIFVDHEEGLRTARYHAETDFNSIDDDCLGECLATFSNRPDFVLLDSGGHVGNVEFNYLVDRLAGPCYIALDDIGHVKHCRSYRQICRDPRFEVLTTSSEKFGFCLTRFVPDNSRRPVRLIWLRTDAIGDSVLSLGLLSRLKELHPVSWLTVVCQEVVGEIYAAQPYVDEVITINRQRGYTDEIYRATLVEWLRELRADYCYCPMFSREELVDILALGSGAGQVVGFAGDDASHHFPPLRGRVSNFYGKLVAGCEHGNELHRYEEFLRQWGGRGGTVSASLQFPSEATAFARQMFTEHQLEPDKTLAFFPGAQHRCRETISYGPALDSFCEKHGWSVIALGSQNDVAIIRQNLHGTGFRWVNLAGETTLLQTAAILSMCRLALGAETGLGHVAAAVDTPHVITLGGGHFGRFFPYHEKSIAVSLPLACYRCNWSCRFGTYPCVSKITPDSIGQGLELALTGNAIKPVVLLQEQIGGQLLENGPQWSLSGLGVVGEGVTFMLAGPKGAVPLDEYAIVGVTPGNPGKAVSNDNRLAFLDLKRFLACSGVSVAVNPALFAFDRLRLDRARGMPLTETFRATLRYTRRWFSCREHRS